MILIDQADIGQVLVINTRIASIDPMMVNTEEESCQRQSKDSVGRGCVNVIGPGDLDF